MNRGMELSEVREGIRDAESAAKVRKTIIPSTKIFCSPSVN